MEYRVISETSLEKFNTTLKKCIEDGWQPAASHFVIPYKGTLSYSLLITKIL